MRVRHLRLTILIGIVALIGISTIQAYWLVVTYQMQEEKFNNTLWMALKEVKVELSQLQGCVQTDLNPVTDRTRNCYIVDVGCSFSQINLEHVLHTVLNRNNLNVSYLLWYYDCEPNQLQFLGHVKGNVVDTTTNLLVSPSCLPHSSESAYYFVFNITNRQWYFARQMQLWLLLLLVVLAIETFFAYTIFAFFRQKRLSELQKDFINNMTHEFKTPISSITIASDVVLSHQDGLPVKVVQYTGLIRQEATRLNTLVENVLKAARLERNRNLIDMQPVDIYVVLSETIADFKAKQANSQCQIITNFSTLPVTIMADTMHFTNLILNLFDNAVKYNTNAPIITVKTEITNRTLLLSIVDNGIGIEKRYFKNIFKKFYRIPTGNVHDVKGFGLGLFYVKQVCMSHKWQISVNSILHKGTQFIISIPIVKITN